MNCFDGARVYLQRESLSRCLWHLSSDCNSVADLT